MKKLLVLLLAGIVAVGLFGCGTPTEEDMKDVVEEKAEDAGFTTYLNKTGDYKFLVLEKDGEFDETCIVDLKGEQLYGTLSLTDDHGVITFEDRTNAFGDEAKMDVQYKDDKFYLTGGLASGQSLEDIDLENSIWLNKEEFSKQ